MAAIYKQIFSIEFTPSGEMGLIPYNGNLEYGYAEKVYLHGEPWMLYSLPGMVPFYRDMPKTALQKRLDALSSVEGINFKDGKRNYYLDALLMWLTLETFESTEKKLGLLGVSFKTVKTFEDWLLEVE